MRATVAPHVLRIALWLSLLAATGALPDEVGLVVGAVASAGAFLAVFALFHDAAHGSLGLPARANDALLFALSAPLLMATHAQRQLHLRHHARPLADDDVEGAAARMPAWRALAAAPLLAGTAVAEGVRAVPKRRRAVVVAELVAVVALAAVAMGAATSALGVYVAVACTLQLTMAFWASYIPHRASPPVLALARRVAGLGSPAVLSLAYHAEHHAQPRIPCAHLRPRVDVVASVSRAA